ncbi:MAG: hypothetical protein GEU94_08325 [Micromonosporaceae bacterium]|nr:hypothetical protein [Micromonosporaceae bacterium]
MGYEWAPSLLDKLAGIEAYEVRQVLEEKRPRLPRPAVGGDGVQVLTVWGRTRAGRRLIVVLRPTDNDLDWLIVGAREMTADQAAEYDRWEADRG